MYLKLLVGSKKAFYNFAAFLGIETYYCLIYAGKQEAYPF
jgi:hypothetical protein